ncbi:hypothetical protein [Amycolatopsis magusensis]|uniref:hypothetical protein n=1 Tax=Amycolatopsis magusensis TaxID=882444 RepID=UPI0024A7F8D7|nr:hypothetical protein [Amycolatopsis magusensis]MDI5975937.1 hypothetical protein [Amycolatopsis magusensis]
MSALFLTAGLSTSAASAKPAKTAPSAGIAAYPAQCKVTITAVQRGRNLRTDSLRRVFADSTGTGAAEEFWIQDLNDTQTRLQSNSTGGYLANRGGVIRADGSSNSIEALVNWIDVDSSNRTFRLTSILSPSNVVRAAPDTGELFVDNRNFDAWTIFQYNIVYCL